MTPGANTVLCRQGCFSVRLGCPLEHWKYPRCFEMLGIEMYRGHQNDRTQIKKKECIKIIHKNLIIDNNYWLQIFKRLVIAECWVYGWGSSHGDPSPRGLRWREIAALGKGEESKHRRTASNLLLGAHRNVKPKMQFKWWDWSKLLRGDRN